MAGNEQLEAVMLAAGFLREDGTVGLKVFGRAVSRYAGRDLNHTYVRRWLNGMVPREEKVRRAITQALGEKAGAGRSASTKSDSAKPGRCLPT